MNEVLLIRPCKTTVDAATGEVRFTSKGRDRLDRLVRRLSGRGIDRILSGPEDHVALTAHSVARALDVHDLACDDRLVERRLPADGSLAEDVALRLGFEDRSWAPPGGESLDAARDRAIDCLRDARPRQGGVLAVVCAPVLLVQVLHYFDGRAGLEAYHSLTRPDIYRVGFGQDDFSIERLWKGKRRTAWLRPPSEGGEPST